MAEAVVSPNKPRPTGIALVIANMLAGIERNYEREGSGPGTRFEGRLLEDVQAEAVIRQLTLPDVTELDEDPDEALAVIEGRHRGSKVYAALCLAAAIRRGAYPDGWA